MKADSITRNEKSARPRPSEDWAHSAEQALTGLTRLGAVGACDSRGAVPGDGADVAMPDDARDDRTQDERLQARTVGGVGRAHDSSP